MGTVSASPERSGGYGDIPLIFRGVSPYLEKWEDDGTVPMAFRNNLVHRIYTFFFASGFFCEDKKSYFCIIEKLNYEVYNKEYGSITKLKRRYDYLLTKSNCHRFKKLLTVVLALVLILPVMWMPALVEAAPADGVYSFGAGGSGQLGHGDRSDRNTPVRISGLANVKNVEVGDSHSLALLHNGDVYSFGSNLGPANVYGMLGLGDKEDRHTPTKIGGIGKAKAIAAGRSHSLVILENGDLYSFGRNAYGELGLGDTVNRVTPAKVQGISKAVAAAGGQDHTLVLLENGDVYGMGSNYSGQLGMSGARPSNTPQKIALPGKAKAVAAGSTHSLVLLDNGDVYSFGSNRNGELGYETSGTNSNTPAKIPGLGPAKAVSAGSGFSLVLLENGDLYAFGYNNYGQLGLGDTTNRNRPTKLALSGVSLIDAGYRHSLAVLENGDVYCWGQGGPKLGLGDRNNRNTPTRIEGLRGNNGLAIAAGFSHSLAVVGTPPISINIDNRPLYTDVPPIILSGRTMVPLRAIFEALDIDVNYDAATRTITGTKDATTIQLTVDSTQTLVNGQAGTLDVPATVMDGRTLVPVRFIAESTGLDVDWVARTRTVVITAPQGEKDI